MRNDLPLLQLWFILPVPHRDVHRRQRFGRKNDLFVACERRTCRAGAAARQGSASR